tara:strand:- start:62 stop:1003 length:942 start_codon:yes stop_codon:yes gene_type:complete
MTKLDSYQLTYRLFAFIIFCSIFSAFASYRLHLDSFIDLYSAGLEEIINGVGRAPDQYRYLPYLFLDQIRHILTIIIGENIEWKWPLITFEATFLALGLCSLVSYSSKQLDNRIIILTTALIYPFIMFDGVRSIASFIFFMSCFLLFISKSSFLAGRRELFYSTLVAFSFTRADVAILVGLVAAHHMHYRIPEKLVVAAVPILAQILLMQYIFPSAEYFSEVVMLKDNISAIYIAGNPVTYLILGAMIVYWRKFSDFLAKVNQHHRFPLILCIGYIVTIFIVGRVNEYRLFLPFLPIFYSIWPIESNSRFLER